MRHKTTIIKHMLTLMAIFIATGTYSQVTYKDYLRADAVSSYSKYVYSPAVKPNWLGESHYFWYENKEKEGKFFYLVNAEDGTKYRATGKEELTDYLPDFWKNCCPVAGEAEHSNGTEGRGEPKHSCRLMASGTHI